MKTILILKFGALGDLIQTFPVLEAIAAHFPEAQRKIITAPLFTPLLQTCPWLTETIPVERPHRFSLSLFTMARRIVSEKPDLIIDLQNNGASRQLFRLLRMYKLLRINKIAWCGSVKGAAYYTPPLDHTEKTENSVHAVGWFRRQLHPLGITDIPDIAHQMDWLSHPLSQDISEQPKSIILASVILAPGSSPTRKDKRWPAPLFGQLAEKLGKEGYNITLVGSTSDQDTAAPILKYWPGSNNQIGCTDLSQLATLIANSQLVIGNDSACSHLAAALSIPALTLFKPDSTPFCHAALGENSLWMQADQVFSDLTPDRVLDKARLLLRKEAMGRPMTKSLMTKSPLTKS